MAWIIDGWGDVPEAQLLQILVSCEGGVGGGSALR